MSIDFVKTYSQLISLSPDAPVEKFYSTADYHRLLTLGPSLPTLSYPLPSMEGKNAQESTTTIKLRSIKPPFKFSTELKGISTSLSIYKLKSQLVEDIDVLRNAGASPSNLKFIVKSKIVTDTTTVGLLCEDVFITVMVSQPLLDVKTDGVAPEPEIQAPKVITAETWREIEGLLVADLGQDGARAAISAWKQTPL
ncbi:hypothetical protein METBISCDRAFT_26308 [Metschnikowia bicuspidata]|uniref:Ubiquitin-like domain-containing protein n=1 Tax=Metschnikowia bicuspidata TaxID=27322 RepID=A0A4P9ZHP2_9ASCO|nr:hypothetical protein METBISCDRAFT_26308 [Metschnikowia bicuspidata]